MVVGSRSSLRRSHPETVKPDLTIVLKESRQQPTLRTKRTRIASLSDQEHLKKRPKTAENHETQPLEIPVRSKLLPRHVPPNIVTQPVLTVRDFVSPHKASDSPKPEYDRFQIIEERARVFIRGGGNQGASQDEKRSLRSHDGGSRSKSELANYFNNYEQMINLEPAQPDVLTPNTRIVLVDDAPDYQPPRLRPPAPPHDPFGTSMPLHNSHTVDLPSIVSTSRRVVQDPLGPEVFEKAHRKSERHEKQMRNIEKERAQHEKYQLDRLLEELKGPDWLRVMGISGVTEVHKKQYEPIRNRLIKEIKAMIEKFKLWKEEEKRRKVEREQALLAEELGVEADEEVEDSMEHEHEEDDDEQDDEDEEVDNTVVSANGTAHDSSDLDALATQQLLQEAKSATKRRKISGNAIVLPPLPTHEPFTSFYRKRHLRDAAVSGHRRGRTIVAFGEPVPEIDEADFELPASILTEDAVKASQRRRRRVRRNSPAE